jgi:hypothetical protein
MILTWSAALLAGSLAACGTTPDSRPQTVEYITLEVLSPACGTFACHSSSTRVQGYAFDTIADARTSLRELVTPGHPERSLLYDVLAGNGMVMPPDAPIATEDVELIRGWILAGAPGL